MDTNQKPAAKPNERATANERYLELRPLAAVANTRAVRELRVSTKIKAPVNHETVPCVCKITGITVEMILPKIPGHVLEYTNPLSSYGNVKGIIEQGIEYLTKLDAQILAGIWLTAYRHYDLVAKPNERGPEAVAINAMLRTAGKEILVDGLHLMGHINSFNKDRLPKFSLDYNAHREFNSVGPALQEYNKAIRNVIYPGAESQYSKSREAVELATIEEGKYQDDSSYVLKQAAKTRLSSDERAYEEQFIKNRREAKLILARLTEARSIPALLLAKLKPVFVGKNLVAMAPETRASVAAKLRSFSVEDAQRLAEIVEQGHNPYDIFADIDDAFTTNESNLSGLEAPAPVAKRSLAEILAAKKNGTYVADPKPVEAVVPSVKLTYTAEDELRHQELEEAIDEGQIISDADAMWNDAYLRAKEEQEFSGDTTNDDSVGDGNGSDF